MNSPDFIANYESVVTFFGRWPSFHDAEVKAYEFAGDSITLTLHTWLMTDEVDARGYFVLKNHGLVSFRFKGIGDAMMDDFGTENILFGLSFSPAPSPASFRVELHSVMDKSGAFSAVSCEVVSVTPCTADGHIA